MTISPARRPRSTRPARVARQRRRQVVLFYFSTCNPLYCSHFFSLSLSLPRSFSFLSSLSLSLCMSFLLSTFPPVFVCRSFFVFLCVFTCVPTLAFVCLDVSKCLFLIGTWTWDSPSFLLFFFLPLLLISVFLFRIPLSFNLFASISFHHHVSCIFSYVRVLAAHIALLSFLIFDIPFPLPFAEVEQGQGS